MSQPDRIGDYEVEAELGAGGMATVYRARHIHLGSVRAIKVLDPRYRASAEARRRFLDEARIQHTHLDHPGIVRVETIIATAEHAAIVMELVEGPNLDDEIATLARRPDEARRIMLDVLAAIGHAHRAGIVHRDIKPANVLLQPRDGRWFPKVTDFGIAKLSADLATPGKKSTQGDRRMGTLHYMSPEQIKHGAAAASVRSDVFALGAMLYELVTGAMAFPGELDYEIMDSIVNGRYLPADERTPGLDPVVAAVIRKAMQLDPAQRFASCDEMAAALRARGGPATTHRSAAVVPPPPAAPHRRPPAVPIAAPAARARERRPLVVGLVAALSLLAIAVAVLLIQVLGGSRSKGKSAGVASAGSEPPRPIVTEAVGGAAGGRNDGARSPAPTVPTPAIEPPRTTDDRGVRAIARPPRTPSPPPITRAAPPSPNVGSVSPPRVAEADPPVAAGDVPPPATTPPAVAPPANAAGGCIDEVACLLADPKPACCLRRAGARAVSPPTTPSTALPDTLTKSDISAGIAGIRAKVDSCGTRSAARGTVKVMVVVSGAGLVTRATVVESPDVALGSCVGGAVIRARFAQSVSGVTFSYPFKF